jgi:hypothetical protein
MPDRDSLGESNSLKRTVDSAFTASGGLIQVQRALPEKCQWAEYAVPSRSPRVSKGSGFCQNFDLEPSLTVGLLLGQNRPNHFSGKVGSTLQAASMLTSDVNKLRRGGKSP